MRLHTSPLTRIKGWVHLHHTATFVLAGIGIFIATAIVITVIAFRAPEPAGAPLAGTKPTPSVKPVVHYSPLTGNVVPDLTSTQQATTGIMIENSPDARPQSGLKNAGVVFEAIAEGGITRFLAVYQESKPQLIGPVRSVRLYYVDWIAPFQASIAHIGGSKFALDEVRSGKYRDIDQFFNAEAYWRATDRYAPHNVYTSFEKLDTLNLKKGYVTSAFTAWPRTDGKAAETPNATSIDVKISGPAYNSHYDYDKATNTYLRSQGGAAHNDREAGQITPSVVIILDTTMSKVLEDGYREQITTIGSGKARIFQNGTVVDATWTKPDRATQITFSSGDGTEVKLNRGQTWITAIPVNQGGAVTWK